MRHEPDDAELERYERAQRETIRLLQKWVEDHSDGNASEADSAEVIDIREPAREDVSAGTSADVDRR